MVGSINLEYEAARLSLGYLITDDIKSIIEELQNNGVYSDDMLEITDAPSIAIEEASPLFQKVLAQNGVKVPQKRQAAIVFVARTLNDLLSQSDNDHEFGKAVEAFLRNYDDFEEYQILDDHLTGPLYWYEHHVLEYYTEDLVDKAKAGVIEAVQAWLEKYKND